MRLIQYFFDTFFFTLFVNKPYKYQIWKEKMFASGYYSDE